MSDMGMITGAANPYEQILGRQSGPQPEPVILKNPAAAAVECQYEKTELVPLADAAKYGRLVTKTCSIAEAAEFDLEEDLLVPDTFPDMEMILHMDGRAVNTEITGEAGRMELRGTVRLQTLYRSAESYGNNISMLPAEIQLKKALENLKNEDGELLLSVEIRRIEYRIINERKYKVKLHISVLVEQAVQNERLLFEGIDNEQMFLRQESADFLNYVQSKTRESDVSEELLINDDNIRIVKIIKSKFNICENHCRITGDKILLNQTISAAVMYLAEITENGSTYNRAMYYKGSFDNSHFVPLSAEGEIRACKSSYDLEGLSLEINRECNGFTVSGTVSADLRLFNIENRQMVTDFYHADEELTCDMSEEQVPAGFVCVTLEDTVKESIGLQQESGSRLNVIFADAKVTEYDLTSENGRAVVSGKIQVDVLTVNEGDYTVAARKNCTFRCSGEIPAGNSGQAEVCAVTLSEIDADIMGDTVSVTARLQVKLDVYTGGSFYRIKNPCIVRKDSAQKIYPITVHSVRDGESLWDIAKRYRVSQEQITEFNPTENIRPGNKIIIVK